MIIVVTKNLTTPHSHTVHVRFVLLTGPVAPVILVS